MNNHGFDLQRSTDGSSFETIAFIKGRGTSTGPLDYATPDKNITEKLYYYRLGQIDFNGKITYSNTITIRRDNHTTLVFEIFPNPVKEELFITLSPLEKDKAMVTIYNLNGDKVFQQNFNRVVNGVRIQLSGLRLTAGTYVVKLETGNEILVKKFYKE